MQKWYKVIVLVTLAILLLTACTRKEVTGTIVEKMMDTGRLAWTYVEVNTGSQNVVLHVDLETYMLVEVGEKHTFKFSSFQSTWTLKNRKSEVNDNGS